MCTKMKILGQIPLTESNITLPQYTGDKSHNYM